MTISPPANVKLTTGESTRALAWGVDWLELSLQVTWHGDEFQENLRHVKAGAVVSQQPAPLHIPGTDGRSSWNFNVLPHGQKKHEWVLENGEYRMSIGKWMEPQSRPSIMAKVACENLWTSGPAACVEDLLALLRLVGAEVHSVKVTRIDLCVDVLVRETFWREEIMESAVMRPKEWTPHFVKGRRGEEKQLTGFSIGSGDVEARLYDKPREIRKSGKEWMYAKWGVGQVPEGHRIIRCEFQLRGAVLKQLKVKAWSDCQREIGGIWAYCTRKWLKFQDAPEKHHTQQRTLPWWEIVQNGFLGVQGEEATVRTWAVGEDHKVLIRQIVNAMASYSALMMLQQQERPQGVLSLPGVMQDIARQVSREGYGWLRFNEMVRLRIAKYQRRRKKLAKASINFGPIGVNLPSEGSQSKEGRET